MSTVIKALSLLDFFSEVRPTIGLSEFQRLSGRDKATVHRHLTSLEDAGYLERDPKSRAYRLGHALERLARLRRLTVPDKDTIAPIVDSVSRCVGELVHLNRLVGGALQQVYLADLGNNAIRVDIDPNMDLPLLTSSSGKAILAFIKPAEKEALIAKELARFGTPLMPGRDDMRAELTKTAARGFSESRNLIEDGVSSIAIPIFDADGQGCAACSIAYPTVRHSPAFRETAIAALFTHGPELVRRLGGQIPSEVATLWSNATMPELERSFS